MAIIEQQFVGIDWQNYISHDEANLVETLKPLADESICLQFSDNPDIGIVRRIWQNKIGRRVLIGAISLSILAPTTLEVGKYYAEQWSEAGATAGAKRFVEEVNKSFNHLIPGWSNDATNQFGKSIQKKLPHFTREVAPKTLPILEKSTHIDFNGDGII
ncbi:MAG: hypothetical protein ACXWLH_02410, partial [Candidatus Saccharimonadales bacterium]